MNDREFIKIQDRMRETLRDSVPPVQQLELRRNLWPEMLRRLQEQPARVPWFDWALLAASIAAAYFFPALIPALFYHL